MENTREKNPQRTGDFLSLCFQLLFLPAIIITSTFWRRIETILPLKVRLFLPDSNKNRTVVEIWDNDSTWHFETSLRMPSEILTVYNKIKIQTLIIIKTIGLICNNLFQGTSRYTFSLALKFFNHWTLQGIQMPFSSVCNPPIVFPLFFHNFFSPEKIH